jgi:hypothetical protein
MAPGTKVYDAASPLKISRFREMNSRETTPSAARQLHEPERRSASDAPAYSADIIRNTAARGSRVSIVEVYHTGLWGREASLGDKFESSASGVAQGIGLRENTRLP